MLRIHCTRRANAACVNPKINANNKVKLVNLSVFLMAMSVSSSVKIVHPSTDKAARNTTAPNGNTQKNPHINHKNPNTHFCLMPRGFSGCLVWILPIGRRLSHANAPPANAVTPNTSHTKTVARLMSNSYAIN